MSHNQRDTEGIYQEQALALINADNEREAKKLEVDGIIQKISDVNITTTYLAGPIGVIPMAGCGEWRDELTKDLEVLGIKCINPLGQFGGDRLSADRAKLKQSMEDGDLDWVREFVSSTIIQPDLQGVVDCTFLTVYIPKRIKGLDLVQIKRYKKQSEVEKYIEKCTYEVCGTYSEVGLAKFLHRPIFIVTDRAFNELPAWLIGCSTWIFSSWGQYLRFVKAKYVDGLV